MSDLLEAMRGGLPQPRLDVTNRPRSRHQGRAKRSTCLTATQDIVPEKADSSMLAQDMSAHVSDSGERGDPKQNIL